MDKIYSIKEIEQIVKELNLTVTPDYLQLVKDIQISNIKDIQTLILSRNKESIEYILNDYCNLEVNLNRHAIINIKIEYGPLNYFVETDYGIISVGEAEFINYISFQQQEINCRISLNEEMFKNLSLNLLYIQDVTQYDTDRWRSIFLSCDFAVIILDTLYLLDITERTFLKDNVVNVFSNNRVAYGLWNIEKAKAKEWSELRDRILMYLGYDQRIFLFFKEIDDKVKNKNIDYTKMSLEDLITETSNSSILLRQRHIEDINRYLSGIFENELISLKKLLSKERELAENNNNTFKIDEQAIIRSQEHINKNINLFLESSSFAFFRVAVEEFSILLKKSLTEDIVNSKDIKRDSRSLSRYLASIWTQFTDDQLLKLSGIFRKETETIFSMMQLDLENITNNLPEGNMKNELIKKNKDNFFNVNAFFSRRTSRGNGLTDVLTIGGLIAGIFGMPVGWVAVAVSEVMKFAGRRSFDTQYKKELASKVSDIIDKNSKQLLNQSKAKFKKLSILFKEEIMSYYSELIETIKNNIDLEESRINNSNIIIDRINNIIIQ